MVLILYLINREDFLENPIFKNQVRSMRSAIQRENHGEFRVTELYLLPWLEITLKGVYSLFRRHALAISDTRLSWSLPCAA
jgi:hypothetical protein